MLGVGLNQASSYGTPQGPLDFGTGRTAVAISGGDADSAPFLTTTIRCVGDRTSTDKWAMVEATPIETHLFRFPVATHGIPVLN